MDYVHGPFETKKQRDYAALGLHEGEGCDCPKCVKKPENGRPKKLPENQVNVFHDGGFWIASRRGQPW